MIRRVTDHPILLALYEYWESKRRGRTMPDRRDVDPVEIPPTVLPNMMLIDLIDGATRARFRLVGTAIVERVGRDHTGRMLDTVLTGDYLEYVLSIHRDVCRHRAPVYAESIFRWDVERNIVTKRLFMPLTNGGDDPAITLVGQIFEMSNMMINSNLMLSNVARREIRREILTEQGETKPQS